MKHTRVLSGVLAALMLTGCANSTNSGETSANVTEITGTAAAPAASGSGSETTAELGAATSAAGTTTTVDGTAAITITIPENVVTSAAASSAAAPLANADIEAVKKVVTDFMEGVITKDYDKIYNAINFDDYKVIAEKTDEDYKPMTNKEWVQEMFGNLDGEETGKLRYKFVGVKNEGMDDYVRLQEKYEESLAEMKKSGEQENLEKFETVGSILTSISQVVLAEVQISDEDGEFDEEDSSMTLPVICRKGEWKIDFFISFLSSMLDTLSRSQQTIANTNAKSVYNAINSALTDMDCEDYKIDQLKSSYVWKGSDFEKYADAGSAKPKDNSNLEELLKYKIAMYYSDVTKLAEIRPTIEKGCCTAIIVVTQKGVTGSYPIPTEEKEKQETKKNIKIDANIGAKSVRNAADAALTDMDSEDIDIQKLTDNTHYTWMGSEFEKYQKQGYVPDRSNPEEYMKYKIATYYGDITELDEVRLACNAGVCKAAAVRTKENKIGSYPKQVNEGETKDIITALNESLEMGLN